MTLLADIAFVSLLCTTTLAQEKPLLPVVTIEQALAKTQENNATWKSLEEYVVQADEYRSIGLGLFLPKIMAEGNWMHLGERNVPDLAAFKQMSGLLGGLAEGMITHHPEEASRLSPYLQTDSGDDENVFDSFVPRRDKLSATFSLIVPVFDATSIAFIQSGYDQYDAALQKIGFAREQLLFGVSKLYFGLCTLQRMVEVTELSIQSAKEHLLSTQVRAQEEAATELEVKRAELEVRKNQAKRIEIIARLEKAKADFRYLTGIKHAFRVAQPKLSDELDMVADTDWEAKAKKQRKDLAAAKIDVLVAGHEEGKVWAEYLPKINLIGSAMFDNDAPSRFDDDPFNWIAMATLNLNVFDGGIREAKLGIASSKSRQAALAVLELEAKVESSVSQTKRALGDATAARQVSEKQLEVARAARDLAVASEQAGMANYLAVIDANTMVEGAEAQVLAAKLSEAVALLDLWAASGTEILWVKP